jgi:hypothetical protein
VDLRAEDRARSFDFGSLLRMTQKPKRKMQEPEQDDSVQLVSDGSISQYG